MNKGELTGAATTRKFRAVQHGGKRIIQDQLFQSDFNRLVADTKQENS